MVVSTAQNYSLTANQDRSSIHLRKPRMAAMRVILTPVDAMKSEEDRPSSSPSEYEEWVAVSSMVKRSDAADKMDELAALGAKDILCLDISNSRSGG